MREHLVVDMAFKDWGKSWACHGLPPLLLHLSYYTDAVEKLMCNPPTLSYRKELCKECSMDNIMNFALAVERGGDAEADSASRSVWDTYTKNDAEVPRVSQETTETLSLSSPRLQASRGADNTSEEESASKCLHYALLCQEACAATQG